MQDETIRAISFVSGKGGTGKTIIVASLGYLLANCGFRVLLVDADLSTAGLTFYLLRNFPRKVVSSFQEQLRKKDGTWAGLPIPHPFVKGRLFLLPAIRDRDAAPLEMAMNFAARRWDTFAKALRSVIKDAREKMEFDYVLIDTRGGTDATSVGAAIGAGGFVLVSEADKVSWDVGARLLGAIDRRAERTNLSEFGAPTRLGFVLNKNVLPSDAIETFLKGHWNCPHLTTIPLDPDAIRFYQQDEVPVGQAEPIDFNSAIVPMIRKLFVSSVWDKPHLQVLEIHERRMLEEKHRRAKVRNETDRLYKLSFLTKMYGSMLALLLLAMLGFKTVVYSDGGTSLATAMIVILTAVLIFSMAVSETRFLRSFFDLARRLPVFRSRKDE